MTASYPVAPPLQVSQWFNSTEPPTLESLRGRVVLLVVFQMLCPGCVSHLLPQAAAIREAFTKDELVVIGLHSVFEHHAVMQPEALQVFLHEYRFDFPVAVDRATPGHPVPMTMQAYGFRGTPSLVLIDRQGLLRFHHFGHLSELRIGRALGALLGDAAPGPAGRQACAL